MFAHTSRDASAQYVVDPTDTIQCVRDDTIAYGAPPNQGSIHVELCDIQGGSPSRWQDDNHQLMLRRAAALVAGLCLKYDLPVVRLTSAQLRAGKKGICGHIDITNAWHQTDHVDPGPDFPWTQFLALVNQAIHPLPAPKPQKGEVMFSVSLKSSPAKYVTNGIYRRWIPAQGYFDLLVAQGMSPDTLEFDSVAGMEATAGPLAPGTSDYVAPVV